jgi:long-chain fatty acid transport protein
MKQTTLAVLSLLAALTVSANGYKILCVRSAKATAMGEAFIVQADDPTAVAFNPAGLADLEGLQLSLQSTWCNAYTERESPSGVGTDMEDDWQMVPAFYATWETGIENLGVGIGVSVPNGLASEWEKDSFASYTGYYSELIIADYTVALGYRLSNHLTIGVGLDFYVSNLDQRQTVPGFLVQAPFDPTAYLEGDGTAWGFNVGLRYEFNERHAIAATYRKGFTVDYEGDLTVQGMGQFDMDTSIDYPGSIVLGYCFRPNEKWTFEANIDWTHWSNVGDVIVDVPSFPSPLFQQIVIDRDYENTFAYKLGVQYQYSEALALRAGYIYNENATNEVAWNPTQPDTDMHFFTVGFGYDLTENVTLESALQVVCYETRDVDSAIGFPPEGVDGTYRTWAPCFTLGVTCRF